MRRKCEVLNKPVDLNDSDAFYRSMVSTADFLDENPMVADLFRMTADHLLSGKSLAGMTEADHLEFWQKLAAPYHPDGRRKS